MVDARVADEPPVDVVGDPRQGDVGCRGHVQEVQPERDVRYGCAQDFVKCARVAQAEGEVLPLSIVPSCLCWPWVEFRVPPAPNPKR